MIVEALEKANKENVSLKYKMKELSLRVFNLTEEVEKKRMELNLLVVKLKSVILPTSI